VNRRRLVKRGIGAAIVLVAFAFVLPKLADYGDVWGELKDLDAAALALLAAATALNLATFAPPLMAALPGISFWQAFRVTQASTASTYIAPGGAALGMGVTFVMLRRWGFGAPKVALAVALTGIWNQLATLGFPAVALGLLTLTGGHNGLLETVGLVALGVFVVAIGVFAVALTSTRAARWAGTLAWRTASWAARALRRRPIGWDAETVVRFHRDASSLLGRRWLALTAATLAGNLTVFAVMLVALRTLGVPADDISAIEAFAAWSVARVLGSIPITPGGLGFVELGLTTLLVRFGGDDAAVVAVVLVYRFLTVVPTLLIGLVAGATARRAEDTEPLASE
jgi:uncharacterized membrane protein YbhN (UPF0104 family)